MVVICILAACGSTQLQTDKTTTEVVAEQAVVETNTIQTQDKSDGAKVTADKVEEVVTNNVTGISPYWFIVGALIFGMIIPQPKFLRAIF